MVVGLVLVFVHRQIDQPATASPAPASEPTSIRSVTAPPPTTVGERPGDPEIWIGVDNTSAETGCWVRRAWVACSTRTGRFSFPTPLDENHGHPANIVTIRANGDVDWNLGNLGLIGDNVIALVPGATYRALGWTIEPTPEGTVFTNDATGHGMFVGVDRVEPH